MRRRMLIATICVLATAAMAFGLVNVLAEPAHVTLDLCRIGTFNLNMAVTKDKIQKIVEIIDNEGLEIGFVSRMCAEKEGVGS